MDKLTRSAQALLGNGCLACGSKNYEVRPGFTVTVFVCENGHSFKVRGVAA